MPSNRGSSFFADAANAPITRRGLLKATGAGAAALGLTGLLAACSTGGQSSSTWLLGRELLAQGMHASSEEPAGTGDVQIWRDEDPDYTLISLSGVEGSALLAAPTEPVLRFLAATESLVPLGAESDRMEGEISALIAALLTA